MNHLTGQTVLRDLCHQQTRSKRSSDVQQQSQQGSYVHNERATSFVDRAGWGLKSTDDDVILPEEKVNVKVSLAISPTLCRISLCVRCEYN